MRCAFEENMGGITGQTTSSKHDKNAPKSKKKRPRTFQNQPPGAPKSTPQPSKLNFWNTFDLSWLKGGVPFVKFRILAQLGSILEAQYGPKSRPKREKIDDENEHVFEVDLFVAWPSLWKDFW